MKIVVLNGSPKGEYSITLQYVRFIQKKFPLHEFKVINVSQNIKKIDKDESAFREVIKEVRSADGILWGFGVFVLAVPSQYMRFIELISERNVEDVFRNKHAAILSTSIHFFDHTAHNYLRAVCEDLRMKHVEALSLDIVDMMKESERRNLTIFAENFINAIERNASTPKLFKPLMFYDFTYTPGIPTKKVAIKDKKVVLLTDVFDSTTNLGKMIDRFRYSFSDDIDLIDLNDIDMQGGCLGCMRCGYDNKCIQKDGFSEFYNNRVRTADIVVFAGTVKGRYLSSRWKMFYDRAFFWTHTPSLVGKQMGYIISGPLSQTPNLVQILEASSTTRQDANHVDIITDECESSVELDALLQNFAERLVTYSDKGYIRTKNFLAIGGQKVFRDDMWGRLRMIWQADHSYYKKHGKYDFPQKDLKLWIFNPVMLLLSKIPKFRKAFYANITKFSSGRLKKLAEIKADSE
jgi:multimeric flavodoxin WrbA